VHAELRQLKIQKGKVKLLRKRCLKQRTAKTGKNREEMNQAKNKISDFSK
jgi:hypothetical protein